MSWVSVWMWIAGGLRVSPRFVSSRFVSAMLLPEVYGRYGVQAVMQQCPVVRWMGGGVAVRFTIPGKEERILETEMQAGRAAETIGGHSMQAVRGGLSTRHNSRATI